MVRYAITDRRMFAGTEAERTESLVQWAAGLQHRGVTLLQVREKDLAEADLAQLVGRIMKGIREGGGGVRVLVNGPAHVALSAGADGLHLRGGSTGEDIERVRELFAVSGRGAAVVSVSCHTLEEVERARGADYVVFGPVFEKRVLGEVVRPGEGLGRLREACEAALGPRVLALGGVTDANANDCLFAGAAGVAGIRMFL